MRLLLDTQIIFWWQTWTDRVPQEARALIEESDEEVFISRVSLWEMAIKISVGKMDIHLANFANNIERDGFSWLGIENHHLLHLAELPLHADHKDPFDRLLVAQSQCEPAILLTTDEKLSRYGETIRVVSH